MGGERTGAGVRATLRGLLLTALAPVGNTMYVWGGGWAEDDSGANEDARTIGVSERWGRFCASQDSGYDYHTTYGGRRDGLDCSGYVGWCIYNTLETESGRPGYVLPARDMAENYAARGWGTYTAAGDVCDYRAGDILSAPEGHVWIAVGACADGSVVLLHASPPGVQLMGTPAQDSRAVALARFYMRTYFPEWYRRYPVCARDASYLTRYGRMRWDISGRSVLTDPDGYRRLGAEDILRDLFRCHPED